MFLLKKLTFSFALSLLSALVCFFASYQIAIIVSPPIIYDTLTQESHLVMPIGQVFIASILSGIVFIIVFVWFYKRFSKITGWLNQKNR